MGMKVRILVGTVKGGFLFRSDESRREWEVAGPFLSGWEVSALLGYGERLLAGTCHMAYGATLRASEDGGETWTELVNSPAYPRESGRSLDRIWQLVPGVEPGTVYAGVDEAGLFVSRDGGITWAEIEGLDRIPSRSAWTRTKGGLPLHSVLVHPHDPQRLWVAVSDGGVFRTGDGGETWTPCHRGLPKGRGRDDVSENAEVVRGAHKIALDPTDPDTLYLQHHCGVYESSNGGDSWRDITEGLPSGFGFPVEVSARGDLFAAPLDPGTRCFVDGRLELYRRKKGRDGWEPVSSGLPRVPYFAGVLRDSLAVDPLEPAGIAFGTTQGDLYHSPDGGSTWFTLPGRYSRITAVKTWTCES